ncbi:MAG: MarR family transcriptional regulator, partial [Cyanobacteria bacterium]|nr:MarR family transcriptional regulator [Cyanobacteriota bacterium]
MTDPRTANLLGALALGLADSIQQVAATQAESGGETAAALVTLGAEPGLSLNHLRQILHLSQPGTVRLVDRLASQGLVERRSGRDGRTLALYLTPAGQARRQRILRDRRLPLQQA